MKLFALSSILLSFAANAEPFEARCYDYWEESESNPSPVLRYTILQDEHGYAEVSECRSGSEDCSFLTLLKPDPRSTDFSQCMISKKGRRVFSICHGDYIPTRETSVGSLITLQISRKGSKPKNYLCDEIYLGGEE